MNVVTEGMLNFFTYFFMTYMDKDGIGKRSTESFG